MLDGCLAWQEEGLNPPKAVTVATDDYQEQMDTVGAFIDECCIRDPELKTPSRGLYEAYKTWSAKHGEPPMNQNDFGARLGEKEFKTYRTKTERGWCGLGLDLGAVTR